MAPIDTFPLLRCVRVFRCNFATHSPAYKAFFTALIQPQSLLPRKKEIGTLKTLLCSEAILPFIEKLVLFISPSVKEIQ